MPHRVWVLAFLTAIVAIGIPLSLMPPWRHVEPIDHVFWNVRYGDFDRHAWVWNPPLSDSLKAHPGLSSPVERDWPRFVRELVAGVVASFLLIALVFRERHNLTSSSHRRPRLGSIAAVAALLIPIPPVGLLAFSSWESLTDSNHGIPFILPTLLYWGVLTAVTYGALRLGWFLTCRRRPSREAF